jgi:hypothetical protein
VAYQIVAGLQLGPGKSGLTDLRAQLIDASGASVGGAITAGFTEVVAGSGAYLWSYASLPDGHRGGVRFYSNAANTVCLGLIALNPEELENTDVKTSTRSTYAGGDTAGTTTLLSRLTSGRAAALDNLDAAISGIASAVWSFGSRVLTAFGFTIPPNSTETAIKAVSDKLDLMIEGTGVGDWRFDSVSMGNVSGALTGDQATKLDAVYAKTALLGTQGVTVVGPVTQKGDLSIIRGFEYTIASGFAPKWSRDDWPNLAGATISLVEFESPHALIASGSVVVAGAGTQTVALSMPGTLTTALAKGTKKCLLQAVVSGQPAPSPLLVVTMDVEA